MNEEEFYLSALYELYGFVGTYNGKILKIVKNGKLKDATSQEMTAIISKSIDLKIEYDNNVDLRLMRAEMPSPEIQLEMMFNDELNGTKTWKDLIKSIKDKYNK